MIKNVLLAAVVFAAGGMGLVFAQDTAPVNSHVAAKKVAHLRIVRLIDRIENQRERIDQGLANKTLTADQAQAARGVLDSVISQMKAEQKANGAKKIMSLDKYAAYNASLDANSAAINEEKQYFYYYGPYTDSSPYYDYYYDAYADTGAPISTAKVGQKKHPRIFKLKDRIENQTIRIDQNLAEKLLTQEQATTARAVISTIQDQMKADYKAAGSKTMTREKYNAYNLALDANSVVLHEQRQAFYYYGPYYNQYYYWD
jgi:hypothetical protein